MHQCRQRSGFGAQDARTELDPGKALLLGAGFFLWRQTAFRPDQRARGTGRRRHTTGRLRVCEG